MCVATVISSITSVAGLWALWWVLRPLLKVRPSLWDPRNPQLPSGGRQSGLHEVDWWSRSGWLIPAVGTKSWVAQWPRLNKDPRGHPEKALSTPRPVGRRCAYFWIALVPSKETGDQCYSVNHLKIKLSGKSLKFGQIDCMIPIPHDSLFWDAAFRRHVTKPSRVQHLQNPTWSFSNNYYYKRLKQNASLKVIYIYLSKKQQQTSLDCCVSVSVFSRSNELLKPKLECEASGSCDQVLPSFFKNFKQTTKLLNN